MRGGPEAMIQINPGELFQNQATKKDLTGKRISAGMINRHSGKPQAVMTGHEEITPIKIGQQVTGNTAGVQNRILKETIPTGHAEIIREREMISAPAKEAIIHVVINLLSAAEKETVIPNGLAGVLQTEM
jgi:hypothetical protein